MAVEEELTLGIDLGIGSCGWAIIRGLKESGEIVAMGTRIFDVPETAKERTPTNQLRRQHRGLRRVLHRRRQRMASIRALFLAQGLIESASPEALKIGTLDPWSLRAKGLDRLLTGNELAVALGHIAIHRGFRSNSKRDRGANAADDSSKMLSAIRATSEKLAQYRTVGEMFAKDEAFTKRKRNRDGDYTHSILRDDQEREVRLLLDRQRRIGSTFASPEFEAAYIEKAFSQRPLQDSEHLVGPCPFEKPEKRAARRAPSFERFRALSRLTALRLSQGREEWPLTAEQIAAVDAVFGQQKKLTFKWLRKLLDLPSEIRFAGIAEKDEGNDFVARAGSAAEGTASLRNVIVEGAGELAWLSLLNRPETLDTIAAILTFRDDIGSIRNGLTELDLDANVLAALIAAVEDGRPFKDFSRAGHISAKAARAIIPYLKTGLVYSEACERAGYNHAERRQTKLEEIANPVAKKALTEALKQVRAITQVYGLPGAIHIELARDVGKGAEERDEIKRGIEKRNVEKDRLRAEFAEKLLKAPSGEELLRYELWKEQNGRCLYTDRMIPPEALVASDNRVQVDHILPWSRSGDDSFVNKTLCFAGANQEKRGRTPFEWFGGDKERWEKFTRVVEEIRSMKGRKKRNYLLRDASILEEKFRPRNLTDTRYACRLLLNELAGLYPGDGARRVMARPGPLTDRLRRAWGIQGLKKNAEGKRLQDDRHHALDALIVAATTEGALQRFTRAIQRAEEQGLHRDFKDFALPWEGFVAEAHAHFEKVFVSRAERRRARGEGHAATIRAIGKQEGETVVFERKSVDALTLKDLDRFKDPDRNGAVIASLRQWIEDGKPKGVRPLSHKGDPIAKVKLISNKKVDVLVREGAAERGEMARVDVFRKKSPRGNWQYFLVPIYPHQIFDEEDYPHPPNQYVQANTPVDAWPPIGQDHEFLWSLFPRCFLEIETSDGTFMDGYFAGLDISTGAISMFPQNSREVLQRGIGTRTLKSFRKFAIDRLGNRFEIEREARTWHGVACT